MGESHTDWSAIHSRLEAVNASITRGSSPGPEERKRILRERAHMLARQPGKGQNRDTIEVVEFMLAKERYGIESRYVREVYPLRDYTPLPCTPSFVLGLLNLRAQIISVIDIKKFFDMPEKGISDLNKVIIISEGKMIFGILADVILDVRNIAVEEIQASIPTLTGIREKFLRGITGERTVILDAAKLLADKDIVVYEEA
jgi:purine-binding chemotaxis protein CheW